MEETRPAVPAAPPEGRRESGPQTTLRITFLGCGAATRMHARTLRRFPGVARAYASRDAERAQRFLRELGGTAWFGSYEEALADPGTDVILVATPPDSHLALTEAALEAGKDVIVEKPAFLRSSDCDRVQARCREAGRRVFVAENYSYKPLVRRLRELLAGGAIGEPLFLVLNAVKLQRTTGWREDRERAGGGALFEGGIHWVHLAGALGLELRSVHGIRAGGGPGPERGMLVTLTYESGAAGALLYSWEVPSPLRGLRVSRIYGREGSIAFESNGLIVGVWGRKKRMFCPGLRDIAGYRSMFADFLRALRTGEEPRMTLDQARRDLELVEAAYRTADLRPDPPANP